MTAEEFERIVGRPPGLLPSLVLEMSRIDCTCGGIDCGLCTHGYPRVATDRPCPQCAESQPVREPEDVREFTNLAIYGRPTPSLTNSMTVEQAARYAGFSVEQWRRMVDE